MLLEYHDHIVLDGEQIRIINSHKKYIVALKVLRSTEIFDEDKVETVLPLLFEDPTEIPIGREQDALVAFFDLFSDKKKSEKTAPSFDIVQDCDFVFSGFMQTYGIDLDEKDMKIEKFIALLKGLPSDTRLAEIIKIRTMPIPQKTKYNAQQIADIMKAKNEFALEKNSFAKSIGSFGKMIKEWASNGR